MQVIEHILACGQDDFLRCSEFQLMMWNALEDPEVVLTPDSVEPMIELHERISHAGGEVARLLQGMRADRFGDPTPCAAYTVRELINHLNYVTVMFTALAKKADMPADGDYLGDDWTPEVFDARLAELVEAWRAPEAYEGTSPSFGLPMDVVAKMVLFDFVIHGWDLAVATGQDHRVDEETAHLTMDLVAMMAPQGRQTGVFGDEVPASPHAGTFERALALSGRDPAWRA
ncbi:TIGR03086 family metal-binding protein [Sinosporangium album]|nr:TIGR03086 family metal-binding protein [Sinosporangium album]